MTNEKVNPISKRIMNILENRDKRKTKTRLANYLSLSQSTITKWKKSPPNIIYIEKICEYLDVSMEWLITGKGKGEDSIFKDDASLTAHEIELVDSYRKLNDLQKSEFLGKIKAINFKNKS